MAFDTKTDGYKALREMFTDDDYVADPWGTGMEWFFSVTHVLYHDSAEEIPVRWGYRHPDFCHSYDSDETFSLEQVKELYRDGTVTDDDLLNFGSFLSTYTGLVKSLGCSG